MAIAPFLVKVLSLRLRMRRWGLCCMAVARAVTPAWLIPFWGMCTSSRFLLTDKERGGGLGESMREIGGRERAQKRSEEKEGKVLDHAW